MSSKQISIGALIFVLVVIMVYSVVMFELYRREKFIFGPYEPPTPPAEKNPFHPLGSVRPMTQDEIDHRNEIIRISTQTAG